TAGCAAAPATGAGARVSPVGRVIEGATRAGGTWPPAAETEDGGAVEPTCPSKWAGEAGDFNRPGWDCPTQGGSSAPPQPGPNSRASPTADSNLHVLIGNLLVAMPGFGLRDRRYSWTW